MQSPVTAMFQLPELHDPNTIGRNLGGLLFTVAGDQLLFSRVDSDHHTSTPWLGMKPALRHTPATWEHLDRLMLSSTEEESIRFSFRSNFTPKSMERWTLELAGLLPTSMLGPINGHSTPPAIMQARAYGLCLRQHPFIY